MTHIILIDPHKEMILHNIPVYENSDVKKIEKWIKMLEAEHPDIERLILSMGTVRIMEHGREYSYNLGNGHSEPRISWRASVLYACGLKRDLAPDQVMLPQKSQY